MSYDQIPQTELDIFKALKDINVVFDVGARDDTDYVRIKPDIELHAFEPNPEFFKGLEESLKDRPKTYLNNYGLGDIEKSEVYYEGRQAFIDGDQLFPHMGPIYKIRTLDQHVQENNIEKIDFLKIDTEGYDLKVLQGAAQTIYNNKIRYIQYEYWNNKFRFHEMLENDWYMTYIGGRNVLCANKKFNPLPTFI